MKYLLPGPIGGQEVELIRSDPGWDYFKWPLANNLNAEMRLPAGLATPVSPPLPEEPPSGVYLIGGEIVQRVPFDDGETHWARVDKDGTLWVSWDSLWEDIGGPDVTIQRLVPSPAKVAAAGIDHGGLPWTVRRNASGPSVSLLTTDVDFDFFDVQAYALGWALIEASGIKR